MKVNWFSTYRVHHRVAQHFRAGPRVPAGRRRAHPQPGRRPGDEHRHRRRREPRVEARRRAERRRRRPACSTPTSRSASPLPGGWSPPPIAIFTLVTKRGPYRPLGPHPAGSAGRAPAVPTSAVPSLHVPHRVADRHQLSQQPTERGRRRGRPRRGSAALGRDRSRDKTTSLRSHR